MFSLGSTRSAHRRDHLLQTPDTFVRSALPCLRGGEAIVHIAPAGGACFTQYTAELAAGGELVESGFDRFLFCLEGALQLTTPAEHHTLHAGGYAHLPAEVAHRFTAQNQARAAVFERRYLPLAGPPLTTRSPLVSRESAVSPAPLLGDDAIQVRTLLPASPDFDFAVNTMTYRPGASLSMVEIHVMEHGLLLLEGGGIYRLGDAWYPVMAGDFIWMAPFCPQWFGALGNVPAKYLIYKDANRHPLVSSDNPDRLAHR